jgi:hypothetical protein
MQTRRARFCTTTRTSTPLADRRRRRSARGVDRRTGLRASSSALSLLDNTAREKGSQSKAVERQNLATRVYSFIIHALDDAGLCAWSGGKDGRKLPGSARDSATQRTARNVESKIYAKGDAVKASLKLYTQTFSRMYVVNSKNGFEPSTRDNDGKLMRCDGAGVCE